MFLWVVLPSFPALPLTVCHAYGGGGEVSSGFSLDEAAPHSPTPSEEPPPSHPPQPGESQGFQDRVHPEAFLEKVVTLANQIKSWEGRARGMGSWVLSDPALHLERRGAGIESCRPFSLSPPQVLCLACIRLQEQGLNRICVNFTAPLPSHEAQCPLQPVPL